MAVTLTVKVSNIEIALASFDAVKIKRSVSGAAGPYTDITASTAQPASLTPSLPGPYAVATKTLQLVRDEEDQVDIVFAGDGPLSVAQVVSQINAAVGAVIAAEVGEELVLASTTTGTASRLLIVGGDAASLFGWAAGQEDLGEDIHIPLTFGQTSYNFVDASGQPSYFYKAQFINTSTGLTAADSAPFQGGDVAFVGSEYLSVAKVDLVDGRGVPLKNQEIALYNLDNAFSVDSMSVALTRQPVMMVTDADGHAEVSLVRGTKWRAVFVGTSLIREFTVPDSTEFNLLTLMGSAPDPFKIAEPQFPSAPRRTP